VGVGVGVSVGVSIGSLSPFITVRSHFLKILVLTVFHNTPSVVRSLAVWFPLLWRKIQSFRHSILCREIFSPSIHYRLNPLYCYTIE
jgi:hypothetical protein